MCAIVCLIAPSIPAGADAAEKIDDLYSNVLPAIMCLPIMRKILSVPVQ